MAWYRVSTCSLTNGSPTVTGAGTAWVANAQAGDAFKGPDDKLYEVQSVNSDISITLASNYAGSTASGQAYAIIPTQGRVRDLAAQVVALITSYGAVLTGAGAGLFLDGTVATPGMSFASDPDCGWYRIGANNIGLATGGALRLNANASGNVTIAAPSSGVALAVSGDLTTTGSVGIGMTPTYPLDVRGSLFRLSTASLVSNTYLGQAAVTGLTPADTGLTSVGGVLAFGTGGALAERMRIDGAGKVGIGASPISTLTVIANAACQTSVSLADAGSRLGLLHIASNDNQQAGGGGGVVFGAGVTSFAAIRGFTLSGGGNTVGDLVFSMRATQTDAALTEAMRISPAGNVTIAAPTSPPSLTVANQVVLNMTSNTNLRISGRGSDGTTRVVNLTLA